MPKFVIERRIPDAGRWTHEELQAISRRASRAARSMGPQVQWVSSIVAGDRLYCTFIADSEALVWRHARAAGFPIDNVSLIHAVIDPSTAEDL